MDFDPWMFALACFAAVAFGMGVESYRPTSEERYQQRVQAHYNLPRWARGDYPERDETRKPNRAFGLDW